MWGKIKSALAVFFRGAFSGMHGFIGAALIVFSVWLWVGFFTGAANIQNYIRGLRNVGAADARIDALRARLNRTELRIKLLQEHSPDFVAEMGLVHLNLGDPALKEIKR
jgi:hypothetical protein